jgi:hypothetical protein
MMVHHDVRYPIEIKTIDATKSNAVGRVEVMDHTDKHAATEWSASFSHCCHEATTMRYSCS